MNKGVHIFLKGISPKVNMIARLELELPYYNVAVQYVNHYATVTPPPSTEKLSESEVVS